MMANGREWKEINCDEGVNVWKWEEIYQNVRKWINMYTIIIETSIARNEMMWNCLKWWEMKRNGWKSQGDKLNGNEMKWKNARRNKGKDVKMSGNGINGKKNKTLKIYSVTLRSFRIQVAKRHHWTQKVRLTMSQGFVRFEHQKILQEVCQMHH